MRLLPGSAGGRPARHGALGQALLETLVALLILSLAALSITGLATAAAAGLAFEQERAQAGACAQAALERARAAGSPQSPVDCGGLPGGPSGAVASVTEEPGPDGGVLWKATVVSGRGTVLAEVYLLPPGVRP